MPLTPFHLGPGLLFSLLFLRYIDLPTFLIANVIIDVEPILILLLNLDYPLHGFLHSFLGGSLVALILTVAMSRVKSLLSPILSLLKLEQRSSFKNILIASLSGVYIHILLDSRMHRDIRPFFPFDINPFLNPGMSSILGMYMFCTWSFIGGFILYVVRLFLIWRKNTQ